MKKIIILIILISIVLIGGGVWYIYHTENKNNLPLPLPSLITQVDYICKNRKSINASFYRGEQKPVESGHPPLPSGSVKIILSDGRNFDLLRTISADGGRYANDDESFIFWSKGNGALVLENNIEKSYMGCIATAKDSGGLSEVYLDDISGFSVRYPADYLIDNSYKYQAFGPGKDISGVKFTIPSALTVGTNLSRDSYISVEIIPATKKCIASMFLPYKNESEKIFSENGMDYSVVSKIGAGAGNRYEEIVYAIPETNPCLAIRYFIHYGAIENYPPNINIKEFNRQTLLRQFDEIRRTLVIR